MFHFGAIWFLIAVDTYSVRTGRILFVVLVNFLCEYLDRNVCNVIGHVSIQPPMFAPIASLPAHGASLYALFRADGINISA
jgi:hypothetical protein